MPHKLIDLQCENCHHIWEDMMMPGQKEEDLRCCSECGSTKVTQCLGGHGTKLHDPAVRSESLKKRSVDHSNKHAKENLGRLADKGILKLK